MGELPAVQVKATVTLELFQPLELGAGEREAVIPGGVPALTVKRRKLLTWPLTTTATPPVMAPAGTGTVIDVALQLVGLEAGEPCWPAKRTRLLPWVSPKLAPAMVTGLPIGPVVGERLEMVGAGVGTVKFTALVAKPLTVTTKDPLLAPAGTDVTMLELLHDDAVAEKPFSVMALPPCVGPKAPPLMVMAVLGAPEYVDRPKMTGMTVKVTALLETPPTVTEMVRSPAEREAGTGTTMLVSLHEDGVPRTDPNATVLEP